MPLMQERSDEQERPCSLFSAPTLKEALSLLADLARRLGHAHQATVTLLPTAGQLQGASATSLSRAYAAWGGYSVPGAPLPASRPEETRLRLEHGGRESLPRWEERATKARGLLSVPLPCGAGHLRLFDPESGDFTPEDKAALSGLAAVASMALESVRLREENAALRREADEADERFQALITASRQVVWVTDSQGAITRRCPTWGDFTGQRHEQYAGWGWMSAIHPDDHAHVADVARQTALTRRIYECEYRVRRDDGTYVPTLARAVPVLNADGTAREWVGINSNLLVRGASEAEMERLLREEQTARSQAEVAEQRAAFLAEASRVLASSSLDPKATLDSLAWLSVPTLADWCFVDAQDDSGVIRRMSVAHADPTMEAVAADVRSLPPCTDGSGHTAHEMFQAEAVLMNDVSDAFMRKSATSDKHYAVMKAVGFHCLMSVPLVARGRSLGALTFLAVRPALRYTQADLMTAQDLARRAALLLDNAILYHEARQSVLLRDEFLSIASHELKTPLTPLQLRLQVLRRETQRGTPSIPTPTVAAQLDVVQRQVTKLSALVTGLLDVSRISSGRLALDREPMDLAELTREVMARFALTASQVGCPVALHTRDDMRGSWDRLRVDQVLTNLLTNALKYGAGKPVHLSLSGDEAHVRIVVEDSGIGIAPEHLSLIFERFGRAVSERHYGGLGLGLYIARQIVESHGGEVRVHSLPGQGSRFEVVLPR